MTRGEISLVATKEFGLKDVESLLINVAYGKVSTYQFLSKFVPLNKLEKKQERMSRLRQVFKRISPRPRGSKQSMLIQGVENVMVKFAPCCSPLPGEEITSVITHGQGVTVHTSGCAELLNVSPERRVEVEWEKNLDIVRKVKVKVVCKNEKGLLARMSNAIMEADSNICSADIKTMPDNRAVNTFEVEVKDTKHLKKIIKELQKIRKVLKVERVME